MVKYLGNLIVMKARIIVGANYGDEGKATVVANYTKQCDNVLNVLTNGGAQRGHSILTKDGSITFQHFGSGTYYNADNYYSRYFILNPMQFVKEYNELIVKPHHIYRDPLCRWSTPYDMIANSIDEQKRNRHASCRMGIWTTIKRHHEMECMTLDNFIASENKRLYLEKIKQYYEKTDLEITKEWKDIWNSETLAGHFINDCETLAKTAKPVEFRQAAKLSYENLIFENGQGLLLCDTGENTYDTTPSNTGILYAMQMLKSLDDKIDVTAHYVTRPYLTRHGDGNISDESLRCELSEHVNEDRTNHFNDAQGDFRFGKLDLNKLKTRVEHNADNKVKYEIELTHCDEMDRVAEFKNLFGKVNVYDTPLV